MTMTSGASSPRMRPPRKPQAHEDPGDAEFDRRLRRQVSAAIIVANLLGALVVFGLLGFVVPTAVGNDQAQLRLNLFVFATFLPVAVVIGTYWSLRMSAPARGWIVAGRPPDERERRATLRQPLRLAAVPAALWLAAAVIFGALNAPRSAALGFQVTFTALLGGLATCSIIYLLVERTLRPLTARALDGGPPARPALPGIATRILLAWAFGTGLAVLGIGLVAGAFLLGAPSSPQRLAATMLFLSMSALLGGLATAIAAARSIADPVNSLRRALAEVESGDLDAEVTVDDGSEVGLLQAGFNRAVAGLRERDRVRDLFGRHVGEDVARNALLRETKLGGDARDVAILFVDILGSTRFAATRAPAEVVEALNRFFAVVISVATAHGGWVNKFEGDAALCVFGAPMSHSDAAAAALESARELNRRLRAELPGIAAAIGVSAGRVVAGNVGAAERFEYTVIGDPVNEAARLTELAKARPERVLASEASLRRASEEEARWWRLGDEVMLRGRRSPTRLVTPLQGAPAPPLRAPAFRH
jgi:adenylate cyclase